MQEGVIIVDVDKICEMLMLDRESVISLLKKFAVMLPDMSKEIKEAIATDDLKLVKALGHKLKGTVGNLRMDGLYKVAEEINKMQSISEFGELEARLDACTASIISKINTL